MDMTVLLTVAVVLLIVAIGVIAWEDSRYRDTARLLSGVLDANGDLRIERDAEKANADQLDKELEDALHAIETMRSAAAGYQRQIAALAATVETLTAARKRFDPAHATNLQLLAQIVAAECDAYAPYAECRAVAQVVINRARESERTILEVLTEPGQFTPVAEGTWLGAVPGTLECAAAYNALVGVDNPMIPDDVLYFCSLKSSTTSEFFLRLSAEGRRYCKFGDTVFYRG